MLPNAAPAGPETVHGIVSGLVTSHARAASARESSWPTHSLLGPAGGLRRARGVRRPGTTRPAGDADAVTGEPRRDVHAGDGHRPGAEQQHVPPEVLGGRSEHVHPAQLADRLGLGADAALRPAQHGGAVGDRHRLVQQLGDPAAVTGAATRRPGTACRIEPSHMPWELAPSGPVTPDRSRVTATASLCSATSISNWSNARLRNVEYRHTAGCSSPIPRPAAICTACASVS